MQMLIHVHILLLEKWTSVSQMHIIANGPYLLYISITEMRVSTKTLSWLKPEKDDKKSGIQIKSQFLTITQHLTDTYVSA